MTSNPADGKLVARSVLNWLVSEVVAKKKAQALNPPDLSYDRVPFDQISEQGAGNYYVFKVPYNKSVPIVYVPREGLDLRAGKNVQELDNRRHH